MPLRASGRLAKLPVLRDGARNQSVPESTIILEYVDGLAAGASHLIPSNAALALQCRLQDRLYDLYVHHSTQKIVGDRLRPADARDALGVPG